MDGILRATGADRSEVASAWAPWNRSLRTRPEADQQLQAQCPWLHRMGPLSARACAVGRSDRAGDNPCSRYTDIVSNAGYVNSRELVAQRVAHRRLLRAGRRARSAVT